MAEERSKEAAKKPVEEPAEKKEEKKPAVKTEAKPVAKAEKVKEKPNIMKQVVRLKTAKPKAAFNIIEKRENPLLKRQEIWVSFGHYGTATPMRQEIIDKLAAELKTDKKKIIVDKIFGFRGRAESKAKVLVYKNEGEIPKAKK